VERREIKFRAWDCCSKTMYPVDTVTFCAGGTRWHGPGVGEGWSQSLMPDVVVDSILMQFTGLLDKDGKEIYEFDRIYHHKYEKELVVTWNQDGCGWNLGDMALSKLCVPNLEVVGSVYE
jgi:uncharacterized phage protein (TIGR01671 family)